MLTTHSQPLKQTNKREVIPLEKSNHKNLAFLLNKNILSILKDSF